MGLIGFSNSNLFSNDLPIAPENFWGVVMSCRSVSFNLWESPLSPLPKNKDQKTVTAFAGFVPTPFLQNNTIYIY